MDVVNDDNLDGSASLSSSNDDTSSLASRSKSKLKSAGSKIVSKTKHAVASTVGRVLEKGRSEHESVANTLDNPAFQPGLFDDATVQPEDGALDKAKSAAKSTAKALIHPRQTIQAKVKETAAGQISSIKQPYALPLHSKALLDAYDDYDPDISNLPRGDAPDDIDARSRQESKKAHLLKLRKQQERLRVAWITRHVSRVKPISIPKIDYPERKDFHSGPNDREPAVLKWLGHFALWYTQGFTARYIDDFESLPFDIATIRSHTERLVMASAPWQVWFMDIRSIYRWENPLRTGRWLATWMVIWYYEYVASFLWASIIYYTIRSRLNSSSMRHLRESIARSQKSGVAAVEIGEFMNRHGGDEWVDPLIEQLGPYIQVQINDLANLLEVTANFYSWNSPRHTMASLGFFGACLLVSVLTDIRYAMKIVWFLVGAGFFFCWPIASLYPRYRLLVSPFRWVFWDIPTHTEWSLDYLRRECQDSRDAVLKKETIRQNGEGSLDLHEEDDPKLHRTDSNDSISSASSFHSAASDTIPETKTLLSYPCLFNHKSGRLHLAARTLSFHTTLSRTSQPPLWTIPYHSITELRKYTPNTRGATVAQHSISKHEDGDRVLEVETKDGEVHSLDLKATRDEVFNYVVGFASACGMEEGRGVVRWQSLQS